MGIYKEAFIEMKMITIPSFINILGNSMYPTMFLLTSIFCIILAILNLFVKSNRIEKRFLAFFKVEPTDENIKKYRIIGSICLVLVGVLYFFLPIILYHQIIIN